MDMLLPQQNCATCMPFVFRRKNSWMNFCTFGTIHQQRRELCPCLCQSRRSSPCSSPQTEDEPIRSNQCSTLQIEQGKMSNSNCSHQAGMASQWWYGWKQVSRCLSLVLSFSLVLCLSLSLMSAFEIKKQARRTWDTRTDIMHV